MKNENKSVITENHYVSGHFLSALFNNDYDNLTAKEKNKLLEFQAYNLLLDPFDHNDHPVFSYCAITGEKTMVYNVTFPTLD